jgi:exopolysaccharide production protein ExoZ
MKSLSGIQVLRGLAASLVVVGHACSTGLEEVTDSTWLATILHPVLSSGVDIFFVISGFIISRMLLNETPMTRLDGIRFAYRRATRIYPLYWIVLGILAILNPYIPINVYGIPIAPPRDLIGLTTTANWLIPQAWTLAFEVYFYAVVTCIIVLAPRHTQLCGVVWLIAQLVAATLTPNTLEIHNHPLVMEFGLGYVVWWLTRAGGHKRPVIGLTLAAAFFFAGALLSMPVLVSGWPRVGTYGLGAFFLVHATVMASMNGARFPRALIRLGDASYSIYVWHLGVLTILSVACDRSGLTAALPAFWHPIMVAAWVVIAFSVGFGSHRFIERPLLALARMAPSAVLRMARPALKFS